MKCCEIFTEKVFFQVGNKIFRHAVRILMKSELTSVFVNLFFIMMSIWIKKMYCKCKFFDVLTVLNEGG